MIWSESEFNLNYKYGPIAYAIGKLIEEIIKIRTFIFHLLKICLPFVKTSYFKL